MGSRAFRERRRAATAERVRSASSRDIVKAAAAVGVVVHDHIIVGRDGHASLKGLRLI